MPSAVRGYAICRNGWSGTITLDDGGATVVTPTGLHSAWSAAARVPFTDSDYAWELTSGGLVRIYHTSGTTFSMTFSSSAIAARLGYSSTSYTSASTYTAEATAPGTIVPYAAADGLSYRERLVQIEGRAVQLTAEHVGHTVAALETIRPVVSMGLTRAQALKAMADWSAYLDTPARVDIAWGTGTPQLARHDAEAIPVSWAERQDYATLSLQVAEVVP